MAEPDDDERSALLQFLSYQRACVEAIVDGLDEESWHTPVVPSGWTVAGLVEHIGDAERHWFQTVVAGSDVGLPWDEGRPPYDPHAAFVTERSSARVLGYYRDQCARSDAVLAVTPMSATPVGSHGGPGDEDEFPTVRFVVLHIIEETACHCGHLEIARELLDGRTGIGLR